MDTRTRAITKDPVRYIKIIDLPIEYITLQFLESLVIFLKKGAFLIISKTIHFSLGQSFNQYHLVHHMSRMFGFSAMAL